MEFLSLSVKSGGARVGCVTVLDLQISQFENLCCGFGTSARLCFFYVFCSTLWKRISSFVSVNIAWTRGFSYSWIRANDIFVNVTWPAFCSLLPSIKVNFWLVRTFIPARTIASSKWQRFPYFRNQTTMQYQRTNSPLMKSDPNQCFDIARLLLGHMSLPWTWQSAWLDLKNFSKTTTVVSILFQRAKKKRINIGCSCLLCGLLFHERKTPCHFWSKKQKN